MRHKIEILDPVWASVDAVGAQMINNSLSFTRKKWGRQSWDFETVRMIESVGNGKYIFPLGLINRAAKAFEEFGEKYEIIGGLNYQYDEPYIKGAKFRDYQERLIVAGLKHGRGVLKAPTATGKSYILLGLISAFSQENILFLCHTKDLVGQMKRHIEKQGFGPVGEWTGESKSLERITVATIQSYVKIAEENVNTWDVILIDEGHHVSTLDGQYVQVLSKSAAPVKLAVTATMPYIEEAKMALEAYVGPLLEEYTIQEAGGDNVLAKPEIEIIKVGPMPIDLIMDISDFNPKKLPSEYQIVYQNAIVKNTTRNLMILNEANKFVKKGQSVLINVVKLEHGRAIVNLANQHYDFEVVFVHGAIKNRENILARLERKEIKVVVATKVFNEGVNIESLNGCINAAGGKSEIETLQKIGRGLRKTDEKSVVKIIDFHDTCHDMLEKQYFMRYRMYKKNGWLQPAGRKKEI